MVTIGLYWVWVSVAVQVMGKVVSHSYGATSVHTSSTRVPVNVCTVISVAVGTHSVVASWTIATLVSNLPSRYTDSDWEAGYLPVRRHREWWRG